MVTDAAAVALGCLAAYVLRFGQDEVPSRVSGDLTLDYLTLTVVIAAAWLVSLSLVRHRRIVGNGPQEYLRVFTASWRVFAVVAVLAYLSKMEVGRAYLAIAFPLGLAALLAGRFGWRQWLKRERARGLRRSAVVVVGHRDTAEDLILELAARPEGGYRVAGVCLPTTELAQGALVAGVPVVGGLDDVADAAARLGPDTVAVTGSDQPTSGVVRRLGRARPDRCGPEPADMDLVLATAPTDVAGPHHARRHRAAPRRRRRRGCLVLR